MERRKCRLADGRSINIDRAIRGRDAPGPARNPPQTSEHRDADDDRHKHAADSIADALDVRAAGLGALHGGDDLGQRGFSPVAVTRMSNRPLRTTVPA